MSASKAFNRERDRMLRSLDEAEFDRFARKWDVPQPARWAPLAKLAAMHKARVHADGFTDEERSVSREWLKTNGFTEAARTRLACPECGFVGGFSNSVCSTCGRLQ